MKVDLDALAKELRGRGFTCLIERGTLYADEPAVRMSRRGAVAVRMSRRWAVGGSGSLHMGIDRYGTGEVGTYGTIYGDDCGVLDIIRKHIEEASGDA